MSVETLNQAEALPETSMEMISVRMVGTGTLYFQNGDVYIGSWRDGDFQDTGEMRYSTGSVYTGEWKDSMYCGHGTFVSPEGHRYTGQFITNSFNGFGRMSYPNGDSFEGEWCNDMKWGAGRMRYASGRADRIGTWVEGKFQSGVEYALPAKCPPKAAKFFGMEHVVKESFTKGASDYFSRRGKEDQGYEEDGEEEGDGRASPKECPREAVDPVEVARSYAAALQAWADSKQTQTPEQPLSAPDCPLSPCSPLVSVTKPSHSYMRERVHSCSYGHLLLSDCASDAKSESKDFESDWKVSGKEGGGCGYSKRNDYCSSDDDDKKRCFDNDVRIEFTDVPLSPGLVAADGLNSLSTRRRTYASEDATSLKLQMNSECDNSECIRESFAACLDDEEDEASFREVDKENSAFGEEYKLALDALRRLTDNLHNI